MINVTESAKKKITTLIDGEGGSFVRITVKAGGCSGLSYDLSFDDQINEGDESYDDSGVKLVTDVRSLLYIINMTLDFSDGINGKGFQFINPNATRTCGCGESFSI